jgi:hypothetical protein
MVPVVRKPHIFPVFQSIFSVAAKRHVCVCLSQWFLWLYYNILFFGGAFETILIVVSASGCAILKLDNLWLFQPMVSVV